MLAEEIEMVGEAGANVVINPLSNTKLKSGIPPIRQLQETGVNLGLGCDNCSCSDVQNMFQAMKLFCLLAAISDAALVRCLTEMQESRETIDETVAFLKKRLEFHPVAEELDSYRTDQPE